jgi:Flp pilus assembly protein TadD
LNPNNEQAHATLGLALGNKGDWDGEITEERQALRLNPNDAMGHNCLGFALQKKGDLRGALEEYHAATTLNSQDINYKQNYERLLHQMKK